MRMKTMIITGGSRGIGAGLVRYFCHRGWQVVFCWNNAEKAAASLAEETGATAIRCDVRDEKQVFSGPSAAWTFRCFDL